MNCITGRRVLLKINVSFFYDVYVFCTYSFWKRKGVLYIEEEKKKSSTFEQLNWNEEDHYYNHYHCHRHYHFQGRLFRRLGISK